MTWYALVFLPEDKILSKPEYLSRVTVSERNAAQAAQGLTQIRWVEVLTSVDRKVALCVLSTYLEKRG